MIRFAIDNFTTIWRTVKRGFGVPVPEYSFIPFTETREVSPVSQAPRKFSNDQWEKTEHINKKDYFPNRYRYQLQAKATLLMSPHNLKIEHKEQTLITDGIKFREKIKSPKPIPYINDRLLKMKLEEIDLNKLTKTGIPCEMVVKVKKMKHISELREEDDFVELEKTKKEALAN